MTYLCLDQQPAQLGVLRLEQRPDQLDYPGLTIAQCRSERRPIEEDTADSFSRASREGADGSNQC